MRLMARLSSYRRFSYYVAASTALASVLAAGCGEGHLSGSRFVLDNINGQPIPAISFENDFSRYVALADIVVLTSQSRGYQSTRIRVEPPGGGSESETYASTTNFTYELASPLEPGILSADIAITFDCPPNAGCIKGPHLTGRIEGSRLSLRERHLSPERLRIYNRK